MYQARSLIGSDASGLSDPFARVICGEYCKTTQVSGVYVSTEYMMKENLVLSKLLLIKSIINLKDNRRDLISCLG